MNVTLVNPPISGLERYGFNVGHSKSEEVPLGVCYIAAVLREAGHKVRIIDAEATNYEADETYSLIKKYKSDVVGITCTTVAFHRSLEFARYIKQKDPDLPIVIGGSHATALPEYTLSFPEFDFVIHREGEVTIVDLMRHFEKGKRLEDINGIAYKRKGKVFFTKPREYIKDLDSLPFPARDLLPDMKLYRPRAMNYKNEPVVTLITSRGCPNQCIFCDRNVFGNVYREHSVDYIMSEIKHVIDKYGARELAFVDDTFTVNRDRVSRLMDAMEAEGIDVSWTCMTRVNTVTEDLLKKMKARGCWRVSFGIETGSPEVMKFIKKGVTLEQVRNACALCRKAGMYINGFFMMGHLVDTKETIRDTINFIKELPIDEIVLTINTPIPNTEQYKIAKEYGTLDTTDWSKFSYWYPVFVPKGLTADYLLKEQKRAYREFYLRPSMILHHLSQIRSLTDVRRYWSGAKTFLNLHKSHESKI